MWLVETILIIVGAIAVGKWCYEAGVKAGKKVDKEDSGD